MYNRDIIKYTENEKIYVRILKGNYNMIENNRSNKKLPLYVEVYNKLLKMIKEGLYPEGSKLPSEHELAMNLNVSRITLRQALSLLQEDRILESKRGVGNFVRKTLDKSVVGLEKIAGIMGKCCEDKIEDIDITSGLRLADEYAKLVFERETSVLISVDRYYKNNGKTVGYCFSVIPTDIEEIKGVNLHKNEEILQLLENDIYKITHKTIIELNVVIESDETSFTNMTTETGIFLLLMESIIGISGNVICYNKYYIPLEKSRVKVNSYL
jgi:GntR family transcriptional regulator